MQQLKYTALAEDKVFLDSQAQAITTVDKNVVVSASAGSGKTTVMIERICNLLYNNNVDIKKLLVVTFVNEASSDIKQKLYETLRTLYQSNRSEKIEQQLNSIPLASISTLHSFCNDTIRTFFYKLGISPNYKILAKDDGVILSSEALSAVFEKYARDGGEVFDELIRIFKQGRTDKALRERVLEIYEFIQIQPYPEKFVEQTVLNNYNDSELFGKHLDDYCGIVKQHIAALINKCADCAQLLKLAELDVHYAECVSITNFLKNILDIDGFDKIANILGNFELGKISTKGKNKWDDTAQLAYEKYKIIRDEVKKNIKEAYSFMGVGSANLRNATKSCYEYIKMLTDLALAYKEAYGNLKRAKGYLDFHDLEHLTIELLQDAEVLTALKERYEYIFVDEYQDINPVQEYILSSLSRGDNMFMVGDVKQSIYGFRLCSPEVFLQKYKAYKTVGGGLALEFNKNYRSNEGILQFVNTIMSGVMVEKTGGVNYAGTSMLVSGREYKQIVNMPSVQVINIKTDKQEKEFEPIVYSVAEDNCVKGKGGGYYEANMIASYIMDIVGKKTIIDDSNPNGRLVKYSDIVILLRSKKGKNLQLFKELQQTYIPISAEIDGKPSSEICVLVDFLRILDNAKQDIPLASVMRSKLGGFSDNNLVKIRSFSNDSTMSFYDACMRYAENINDDIDQKLKTFFNLLEKYAGEVSYLGISQVLINVMSRSNYDAYVLSLKNGQTRYDKLNNFILDIARSSFNYDLHNFVLRTSGGLDKLVSAQSATSENDSVRLMTVHKSKGLEFPIVIFAGTGNPMRINKRRTGLEFSHKYGIGMSYTDLSARVKRKTLNSQLIEYYNLQDEMFEELRVLYVCLTRAKHHLAITGVNGEVKDIASVDNISLAEYVSFLDIILTALRNQDVEKLRKMNVICSHITDAQIKGADIPEPKVLLPENKNIDIRNLQRLLDVSYGYEQSTTLAQKYTVTALNKMGEEEEKYQPATVSLTSEERIARGVLSHRILEKLDLFNGKESDIDSILQSMLTDGEITQTQLEEFDKKPIVKALHSEFIRGLAACEIYRELPFLLSVKAEDVGIESDENIMVQGQVDMLAINKDRAVVVDFKSTGIKNVSILRERYGKQLNIYSLAVVKAMGNKIKNVDKYIYSIESGEVIKM